MRCVDLYNQSQSKWFEEIVTTSLVRNHPSRFCCANISVMVNDDIAVAFNYNSTYNSTI